jgi:hypothetical protein
MSNDPRIIREGGFQGTHKPAPPTALMAPQIKPVSPPKK